jgi:hypothetical protein
LDDGRVRGRREGRDCPEVVHWPRCNRRKLLLEARGRSNSPKSVGYNIQSDEHHDQKQEGRGRVLGGPQSIGRTTLLQVTKLVKIPTQYYHASGGLQTIGLTAPISSWQLPLGPLMAQRARQESTVFFQPQRAYKKHVRKKSHHKQHEYGVLLSHGPLRPGDWCAPRQRCPTDLKVLSKAVDS